MAIVFLAGFAVFAVIDWVAVSKRWRSAELVAKPATLVMLIGYAATGENVSPWLLIALVCSLLGDVYMMLPRDAFTAGLAAFLAAHVAYVIDLARGTTPGGANASACASGTSAGASTTCWRRRRP